MTLLGTTYNGGELRDAVNDRALINPYLRRRPGCQGIKIFGGRSQNSIVLGGAGTSTYETAMELDARSAVSVGSIAPIIAASRAASGSLEVGLSAPVNFVAALADLDSTWTGVAANFWVNNSAARLPVATTNRRRGLLTADQVEVVPPARSDGGVKPLAVCRASIAATTLTVLGDGTDSFTNWSARAAGKVRFRGNSGTGDQSAATSGWSQGSVGLCVGFAYSHFGPIANVMLVGDSIGEGRGTYLEEGFGLPAIDSINAGSPQTWLAYSNFGWSGANYQTIQNSFFDAVNSGIVPDILVFPCGTINDVGPGGAQVTATIVNTWRARLAQILAKCAAFDVTPIVYTIPPVNNSANGGVYDLNSSDALRVAWNAEVVATCAASKIACVNIDGSSYAGITSSGQVQIGAGQTADFVHPNDAGNGTISPLVKTALQTVLKGYL